MSTSVTVLSYNVSFEAMTNKSNPKFSAARLGKKCVPTKHNPRLTICAEYMAHTIDKAATRAKGSSLDFVAIQEASRWDELQKAAIKSLANMGSFGSIQGYTEIVTFYDMSKYRLDKKHSDGYNTERPFQILVFKNTLDTSGTIFINTHNPHPSEMPQSRFNFSDMDTHLSKAITSMHLSDAEKAYRIIIAGDFNETGWYEISQNVQRSWAPFSNAGITTTVSIGDPVYTCCKGDGEWKDHKTGALAEGHRGGDYIFDSKAIANIKIPIGYKPLKLQSDHLPVVAVL